MTQNSQPRLSGDLRQEGGEIPAVRGDSRRPSFPVERSLCSCLGALQKAH